MISTLGDPVVRCPVYAQLQAHVGTGGHGDGVAVESRQEGADRRDQAVVEGSGDDDGGAAVARVRVNVGSVYVIDGYVAGIEQAVRSHYGPVDDVTLQAGGVAVLDCPEAGSLTRRVGDDDPAAEADAKLYYQEKDDEEEWQDEGEFDHRLAPLSPPV